MNIPGLGVVGGEGGGRNSLIWPKRVLQLNRVWFLGS